MVKHACHCVPGAFIIVSTHGFHPVPQDPITLTNIVICIRQPGRLEIEDWCTIDVPEVPNVGDYISLSSLDVREPLSEDCIVRHVWWRLKRGADGPDSVGSTIETLVECDVAIGPYASKAWQERVRLVRSWGIPIEVFDVARITAFLGNYIAPDEREGNDAA
jgi:hypothetical protein